jgi:hypothetical protein
MLSTAGQDSSLGIATCHKLNGQGIEFLWRQDFLHLSGLVLGLTQPPVQWVPYLFSRGKAVGAWH